MPLFIKGNPPIHRKATNPSRIEVKPWARAAMTPECIGFVLSLALKRSILPELFQKHPIPKSRKSVSESLDLEIEWEALSYITQPPSRLHSNWV